MFLRKRPVTFNGLYGVTSEKIELFIATAVRNAKYVRIVGCFENATSNGKRSLFCSYTTKMTGTKHREIRENIARDSFLFLLFSD
jgi:hypothetical protein